MTITFLLTRAKPSTLAKHHKNIISEKSIKMFNNIKTGALTTEVNPSIEWSLSIDYLHTLKYNNPMNRLAGHHPSCQDCTLRLLSGMYAQTAVRIVHSDCRHRK